MYPDVYNTPPSPRASRDRASAAVMASTSTSTSAVMKSANATTGDPGTGEFQDAEIIATFGEVDVDVLTV